MLPGSDDGDRNGQRRAAGRGVGAIPGAGDACDGVVVQMPAPPRLIEGGIPTEALAFQQMAEIADRGLVGHRLVPEINADETPHRMGVVERFFSSGSDRLNHWWRQ